MPRYRLQQIKLSLDEGVDILPIKIAKKFKKISPKEIHDVSIVKRSWDARGDHVIRVLTVDFSCDKKLNCPPAIETKYEIPKIAEGESRPVIVGFGPCGMFCALVLARAGLKPIVIERGLDVDSRTARVKEFWSSGQLDTECNVQFGEGGAGTFSDGKLNTGIKDPRIKFVLETFVGAGADPDILIDARPHIGTDSLREVVRNIREEIISLGGEVIFGTKMESLLINEGCIAGLDVVFNDPSYISASSAGIGSMAEQTQTMGREIKTDTVVLAIGHSARDTVRTLNARGIQMEPKPFSMGVRVEHPQALIDEGMYGKDAGHPDLPPAYYKLATRAADGRGVYSFCMCPGGEIVNAASQFGGVVTNGMSNHDRDSGYANSGILVDVRPEDYAGASNSDNGYMPWDKELNIEGMDIEAEPFDGVAFQEYYEHLAYMNGGENYNLPTTTWGEYRSESPYARAVMDSLPDFVARDIREAIPVFGKKIKGFDNDDTVIKAVESRSSSPVRIVRDRETLNGFLNGDGSFSGDGSTLKTSFQSRTVPNETNERTVPRGTAVKGFYPGGEGAGYAGGITSAACDGIKIAEKIIAEVQAASKSDRFSE